MFFEKVFYNQFNNFTNSFPLRVNKPFFRFLKGRNNGSFLTGVEVGVAKGENAFNVLSKMKYIRKLYLVDPYPIYVDGDGILKDYRRFKKQAEEKLGCFKDKVSWLYLYSKEAVKLIKEMVDFVYIDGEHTYEAVSNDIKVWYPLVKNDGLIGGDDFCYTYKFLMNAVMDFRNKKNLQLYVKGEDWWFIK